ncbi:hypothetical protein C8Q78DRAFT_977351 [Trametes maxima]|nr:hypothetical protein C8Q78DRAFT_977351 [Trametes maxima]
MIVAPSKLDSSAKQALLAVVQVWLGRLQIMSVVTTFFASSSMLHGYASVTLPPTSGTWSNADLLKTATLGGAIILHFCAAILAYLASFVLIRYRLDSAEERAQVAEHPDTLQGAERKRTVWQDDAPPLTLGRSKSPALARVETIRANLLDFRSLVSVYQVKPFAFAYRLDSRRASRPRLRAQTLMTRQRYHTVVAVLFNVGFVRLAVVGTITYF